MATTLEKRTLPWPLGFYRSAIGKKWVMAITGIAIILFVLAHMVGNWKIFLPDVDGIPDIDIYAEALRQLLVPFAPEHVVLWLLRTGLIVAFLLHIHAAYSLTLMNRRARPDDYQGPRNYVAATYASRTMRWSGTIFGAFLLFHLADLTWGIQPMAPETWERGEVYANFVATFSRAPVTALLCGGDGAPRAPSLSRCVVDVPESRDQPPSIQRGTPGVRCRACRVGDGRQRHHASRRSLRFRGMRR